MTNILKLKFGGYMYKSKTGTFNIQDTERGAKESSSDGKVVFYPGPHNGGFPTDLNGKNIKVYTSGTIVHDPRYSEGTSRWNVLNSWPSGLHYLAAFVKANFFK